MVAIKRVLISESVDPCCKKILQENGIEVTERAIMSQDELKELIKVTDNIVFKWEFCMQYFYVLG